MPKTKTDPKPKTESRVWYYAGRRLSGRKIVHAWYDPADEKTRHFTRPLLGSARAGQGFNVTVSSNADGVTVHGTPEYVSGTDDAPAGLIDGWRAEDRVASVLQESERQAKRDGTNDELDRALEVLRRHYHSLRTWPAKSAFIGYATNEITMPPTKRREES